MEKRIEGLIRNLRDWAKKESDGAKRAKVKASYCHGRASGYRIAAHTLEAILVKENEEHAEFAARNF